MQFFPDMSTFIKIGNFQITWYAIIILTGAFLAYYLTLRQVRKWGYKDEIFENFFLLLLPIGILGARIYYVIFEWEQYAADPISILYIWNGGLAIYGGIIAGTIFGIFYFRHYNVFHHILHKVHIHLVKSASKYEVFHLPDRLHIVLLLH